jgi:hypothetical protein
LAAEKSPEEAGRTAAEDDRQVRGILGGLLQVDLILGCGPVSGLLFLIFLLLATVFVGVGRAFRSVFGDWAGWILAPHSVPILCPLIFDP